VTNAQLLQATRFKRGMHASRMPGPDRLPTTAVGAARRDPGCGTRAPTALAARSIAAAGPYQAITSHPRSDLRRPWRSCCREPAGLGMPLILSPNNSRPWPAGQRTVWPSRRSAISASSARTLGARLSARCWPLTPALLAGFACPKPHPLSARHLSPFDARFHLDLTGHGRLALCCSPWQAPIRSWPLGAQRSRLAPGTVCGGRCSSNRRPWPLGAWRPCLLGSSLSRLAAKRRPAAAASCWWPWPTVLGSALPWLANWIHTIAAPTGPV